MGEEKNPMARALSAHDVALVRRRPVDLVATSLMSRQNAPMEGANWQLQRRMIMVRGLSRKLVLFSIIFLLFGLTDCQASPSSQPPGQSKTTVSIQEASASHPVADLTTAIEKVAEETIPAVVHVEVTESQEVANPLLPFENDPFFHYFFNVPRMPRKFKREMMGLGSGTIIDSEGHILTNNHVVAGATTIKVLLSNGDEYPAKVVGTDPKTDLAVIQINPGKQLPHVTFGDSDKVQVGQWVVAIGQPRGLSNTVTQGIISAKHRTGVMNPSSYQDYLQTDAAINPGNSGGPLLTLDGKVIGVNAAIVSESGGFEGIGFAIPSDMAVYVTNQLIAHGKVERGWLGVSIQGLTPEMAKKFGLSTPRGALVADVVKGSPADKGGIKRGDVVLSYQGNPVPDAGMLRNDVALTPAGTEAKLTVWRDGKEQQLTVRIGSQEEAMKILAASVEKRMGVTVRPVTSKEAQRYGISAGEGVAISSVNPQGPLGEAGFEVGDIILEMNGTPVEGVDGFVELVAALPPNQKVVIKALDHRTGRQGLLEVVVR
jgi:serine protease Do